MPGLATKVYVVMYQLRLTSNTIGAFSTKEAALAFVKDSYFVHLLADGSGEYDDEQLRVHDQAVSAMFGGDAHFNVRDRGEEVWIDLVIGDQEDNFQSAMFTITEVGLDDAEVDQEEVGGDTPSIRFVHPAPKGMQ